MFDLHFQSFNNRFLIDSIFKLRYFQNQFSAKSDSLVSVFRFCFFIRLFFFVNYFTSVLSFCLTFAFFIAPHISKLVLGAFFLYFSRTLILIKVIDGDKQICYNYYAHYFCAPNSSSLEITNGYTDHCFFIILNLLICDLGFTILMK